MYTCRDPEIDYEIARYQDLYWLRWFHWAPRPNAQEPIGWPHWPDLVRVNMPMGCPWVPNSNQTTSFLTVFCNVLYFSPPHLRLLSSSSSASSSWLWAPSDRELQMLSWTRYRPLRMLWATPGPEHMPERMSDRMLDRMRDRMPVRMSEQMSNNARKNVRQNVEIDAR